MYARTALMGVLVNYQRLFLVMFFLVLFQESAFAKTCERQFHKPVTQDLFSQFNGIPDVWFDFSNKKIFDRYWNSDIANEIAEKVKRGGEIRQYFGDEELWIRGDVSRQGKTRILINVSSVMIKGIDLKGRSSGLSSLFFEFLAGVIKGIDQSRNTKRFEMIDSLEFRATSVLNPMLKDLFPRLGFEYKRVPRFVEEATDYVIHLEKKSL